MAEQTKICGLLHPKSNLEGGMGLVSYQEAHIVLNPATPQAMADLSRLKRGRSVGAVGKLCLVDGIPVMEAQRIYQ